MTLIIHESHWENLLNFIFSHWKIETLFVYIWIDVWKDVLDVSVVIWDSEFQEYLWTIDNWIKWFKQLESIIIKLIWAGIDENNIFFACENTWVYTHDCMDYFDNRIPNTYILKSSLTFQARKYYAKADFKTDLLDSAVVALTLNDLHTKWKLECKDNPYNKDKVWIWFVRRSFGKEMSSLRHIFRMLAELRWKKSEIVTSIWGLQYRIFPELDKLFECRSQTKKNIINCFSREDILWMNYNEFINKYKSEFWNKSVLGKIRPKMKEFFNSVHDRWKKTMRFELDTMVWIDDNDYILSNIRTKLKQYEFIVQEMNDLKIAATKILSQLQSHWFFIPKFKWVSTLELWLFLWELWNDIYEIWPHTLMWFAGRHPNIYESGGWHPTKVPRFSTKKSIIKKYLYVWMWWFSMHNPSFRLYKNLYTYYYWVNSDKSLINSKLRKKIQCKSWDKFLKIILICFKNKCWFDENKFISDTILPLIDTMKNTWLSIESIKDIITETYWSRQIPPYLLNL